MLACWHCGKPIKRQAIRIQPPNIALMLGEHPKSYHPRCYRVAEREAAKALGIKH